MAVVRARLNEPDRTLPHVGGRDGTECWLGLALWALVIVGGATLGAGGAWLVLRRR